MRFLLTIVDLVFLIFFKNCIFLYLLWSWYSIWNLFFLWGYFVGFRWNWKFCMRKITLNGKKNIFSVSIYRKYYYRSGKSIPYIEIWVVQFGIIWGCSYPHWMWLDMLFFSGLGAGNWYLSTKFMWINCWFIIHTIQAYTKHLATLYCVFYCFFSNYRDST